MPDRCEAFFFSSRRRHTRLQGDWSSDVCSSDLGARVRLETIAVRAGAEIDPTTGALAPPLHLSTTFEHGPASEAIHGFLYVREKNPPQLRLEAALRDLAGGVAAVGFSSGMAAAA